MMYTMPKNLLSICVNFTLATQPTFYREQKRLHCLAGKGKRGSAFECWVRDVLCDTFIKGTLVIHGGERLEGDDDGGKLVDENEVVPVIGCSTLYCVIAVNAVLVLPLELEVFIAQGERLGAAELLVVGVFEDALGIFHDFAAHIPRRSEKADRSECEINQTGDECQRVQPVHEHRTTDDDDDSRCDTHHPDGALHDSIVVEVVKIKVDVILFGNTVFEFQGESLLFTVW